MGRTSTMIKRLYRNHCTSYHKKRKQWLKNIAYALVKNTPKRDPLCKHPFPSKKFSLMEILCDGNNKDIIVEGCYLYKKYNCEQYPFTKTFPFVQFLSQDPLTYVKNMILPYIKRYITQYDTRVESFIETLYVKKWQIILQIMLSVPILDQQNRNIDHENNIYLDDPVHYIVERLVQYNVKTRYSFGHLFYYLTNTMDSYKADINYQNDKLFTETFIDFHLEPYNKDVGKYQHYLSFRFHIPKAIFADEPSHSEEIEKSTLMIMQERYKRFIK